MVGYPHLPPAADPPPKRSSPTVLIVVLLLCVAVALAVFGALAFGIVKVIEKSPQTRLGAENLSAVPFVGPDPWIPVHKVNDDSNRYALEKLGFAIDLPFEPFADFIVYTADNAKWMTGHFDYYGDKGERTYNIYGIRERDSSAATTEHAADSFEYNYTSDSQFQPVELKKKDFSSKSKKLILVSGSYHYQGVKRYVEAVAFGHHGYIMAVSVVSVRTEGLNNELMKMLRTIDLNNPDDVLSGQAGK